MGVLNHVGHCVSDLERSTRFYVEALGFTIERDLVLPGAAVNPLLGIETEGLTARYLRLGEFTLELMAFEGEGNPPWRERVFNEPGLTHLSISVDDVAVTIAKVTELGGELVTDLKVAAMVRDPDGQLLELLPMSYRDSRPPRDRSVAGVRPVPSA